MRKNQTSKPSKTTANGSPKKRAPTPTKKDTKPAPKPAAAEDLVTKAAVAANVIPTPETREPAPGKLKPEARDGSKKAAVLALLRREGGATLGEIAKSTDWQLHSIRGFLSTLGKKTGLKVESIKGEGEQKRRYHIA